MTDVVTVTDDATARPARGWRWARVVVWTLLACWLAWAAVRLTGADRFTPLSSVLIPAIALTPYVAAGVVIPVALAALTRNWVALGVALAVAAVFAAIVLPRAFGGGQPRATGPELRVLTANLRFGAAGDKTLVDLVRRTRADVLSVQEFTPDAAHRLDAAGIAHLLPYRVIDPRYGPQGSGLYARYPLTALSEGSATTSGTTSGAASATTSGTTSGTDSGTAFAMPSATLAVPGTAPVRLTAAHPPAPLGADAARWRHDLARIPRATPHGQVGIVAGDFNASLDSAPLRGLIGSGFTDAADATGKGLVPTFRPWPPITIDHVLADRRCAVEQVEVYFQPASDHRALFARLRLP